MFPNVIGTCTTYLLIIEANDWKEQKIDDDK